MNIKVELKTNIADGSEVVFRSPADCSQVTGLVIYHTGGKTEFAFADAHGHNVGDIDHLFAENAVVKVILDVTAGMAFVQNADTNAYIERTFVKSVNGKKPDKAGNVELNAKDVGALSQDALGEGVNQALHQAKESGAFDGKDGTDGKDGKDGKDGNDYILTDADKQEIAEMIKVPEMPCSSGEYVEATRLDIRNMIEKGCYLLSSTGLATNKTALVVDAGYAKIPVSTGDRYLISSYIPSGSGIIFYGEDGSVVAVDEGGQAGGGAHIKDYEVTIPEGCTTMGVSTRKRTSEPITVKKVQVKPMTPQDIGEALAQQESIHSECETNEDDRLYSLENRLGFSFKGLDNGKVVFMTDGTRPILSDVYSIFKNHGMVLSVAPVYSGVVTYPEAMNDTSTALEFLHMVEDDGGEIYAHSMNGDALTADTAEEMLRESKRWLTEEGFKVHGWIAPRGIFCPEARELYAKYYRYGYFASDKADSPLNFARPYLSTLGLDGAKAAIDACEADKSVIVLFHHWSDNEIEGFNLEDLEALLSYIETKNVDVTTYRECFYSYGNYGATREGMNSGGGIKVSGAKVGQILKVKEVDENGVPTAWETAEMPVGGNEEWELIVDYTVPEGVQVDALEFTKDLNGNDFDLKKVAIFAYITASETLSNRAIYCLVSNNQKSSSWDTGIQIGSCMNVADNRGAYFTYGEVVGDEYYWYGFNPQNTNSLWHSFNSVRTACKMTDSGLFDKCGAEKAEINCFKIRSLNADIMGVGSTIKIMGVRK